MKLRRFAGLKAYVKSHQGLTRPRGIPRLRAEVTLKHLAGDIRDPEEPGIPRLRAEVTLKLRVPLFQHTERNESLGYLPR